MLQEDEVVSFRFDESVAGLWPSSSWACLVAPRGSSEVDCFGHSVVMVVLLQFLFQCVNLTMFESEYRVNSKHSVVEPLSTGLLGIRKQLDLWILGPEADLKSNLTGWIEKREQLDWPIPGQAVGFDTEFSSESLHCLVVVVHFHQSTVRKVLRFLIRCEEFVS